MKIKSYFIGLLTIMVLTSCAHHRDVRPGVEGIHKVRVVADSSEEGARDALDQAQNFCEKRKKDAAFIKETKKYTGDMDEKTYKTLKKASKVAQVVGGSVWGVGSERSTRKTGGIVGLGGATADIAAGKGYTVEMQFKCI